MHTQWHLYIEHIYFGMSGALRGVFVLKIPFGLTSLEGSVKESSRIDSNV